MKKHADRSRWPEPRLVRWAIGFPKSAAAAFIVLAVALSFGLTRVKFETRFGRDLPQSDPFLQTNLRFEEVFGEKDLLMVGLVNDDGIYNTQTLAKILAISDALEKVEGVIPGSVKSICSVKNISASESVLGIGPFFEEPPRSEEEVKRIRAAVEENFMARGRLVSDDATTTVLRASLESDHDVERMYEEVRAIADAYAGPERIYLAGDTVIDYEVTSSMIKDVTMLFPASLLLAVVILLAAFRRISGVVAPCISVVATTAASLGLMGFWGMPVTVVGSILPVVIVAVVSAYGIHMVNMFNHEYARGGTRTDALRRTMQAVAGPVAVSAITSAIGFGSLIIFKIRSIHDFGLILFFAILFGLCSALLLIPSILAVFPFRGVPGKGSKASRFIDWLIVGCYGFIQRRKKMFAAVVAAGLLLALVSAVRLRVGLEPAKFFPEGHSTRQSLDVFDRKLGGSTYFNVMVETTESDGIIEPGMLRKMDEFQKFAESRTHVGFATSFVDVVKRLHFVLGGTLEDDDSLPDDRSQVAQYLLLYSIAGDPTDFEEIVDCDYRRAKLIVMLNTYDDAEHLQLYRDLKRKASDLFGDGARVEFGGRAMILLGQDRYIVVGKALNIACSFVIVWLVCTLYFRSISGGLLSIIPLALSTVYTFGLMGLTGMRLNVATAMTTGIAVGVGVDFAVQFIHRFRDEYLRTRNDRQAVRNALVTTGKGIIFNTLSVSCGFLVFMGSRFQALRDFGWLIALTMCTCAVGTLIFLPPLIQAVRPQFIYGRQPEHITRLFSFRPLRIPLLNIEFRLDAPPWLSSGLRKVLQYL